MKKIVSLLICAVLIVSSLVLTSCGKTLEFKDGNYYCSQNGVTYQLVSFDYTPVALGEEYATLIDGNVETKLFRIQGAEPEKWLSTEDGSLLCAVGEKIPTLDEMNVNEILVCYESVATISIAVVKEAKDVSAVVDNFKNGMELEYPVGKENERFLKLHMSSKIYPWLYFSIAYVEFAEDILECDYPADIDAYEYRDVDDSVSVKVYDEYECWYAFSTKDEEKTYTDIAEKSGTKYSVVKKANGDGTFTEYVRYVFSEEKTTAECIEKIIKEYKRGSLTEGKLRSLLESPDKGEIVNIVEYNYGKYFIYDRVSGKCVMATDLLHSYVSDDSGSEK